MHIPIPTGDMEVYLKGIQEEKIKSDTVYRMVEQMNRELNQQLHQRIPPDIRYSAGQEQLSRRYPLLLRQRTHRHRVGTVLASLGVDEDIIMEDYRLSNDYFNIPSASKYAYQLACTLARSHHHPLLGTRGFPERRHRRNGTQVR